MKIHCGSYICVNFKGSDLIELSTSGITREITSFSGGVCKIAGS